MDGGWLIVFVALFIASLAGLFLYGWRRRKEKPPPGVKPLPDDDDDWDR
jgi:LPXTG-motif cell wall-anchored protein